MNSIGIDFQKYASVICLRESNQMKDVIRSIGDGISVLIPNISTDDKQWGNAAIENYLSLTKADLKFDNIFDNRDRFLSFWENLYKRIYDYLGYLEPIRSNGYHLTVGTDNFDSLQNGENFNSIIQEVGFNDFEVIPSTVCLLCRWIKEYKYDFSDKKNISVIVIGELSTSICSIQISGSQQNTMRLDASSRILKLSNTGLVPWLTKIFEKLDGLNDGEVSDIQIMKSYDAALRFGSELKRSMEGQTIRWTGRNNNFSKANSPVFTKNECETWSEVASLYIQLPDLVKRSLNEITANKDPDVILVGGIGAVFPFGLETVGHLGKSWSSRDEINDIAKGASWFVELPESFRNELQEAFKDVIKNTDEEFSKNLEDDFDLSLKNELSSQITVDEDILPPWERK